MRYGLLYIIGLILLTACSDESPPAHKEQKVVPSEKHAEVFGDGDTLQVHTTGSSVKNMRYHPREIYAEAGSRLHIVLVNKSVPKKVLAHNMVLVRPGDAKKVAMEALRLGQDTLSTLAASPMAQPGDSLRFTWTVPEKPGKYRYICTYPGHWQKMQGTLYVIEH